MTDLAFRSTSPSGDIDLRRRGALLDAVHDGLGNVAAARRVLLEREDLRLPELAGRSPRNSQLVRAALALMVRTCPDGPTKFRDRIAARLSTEDDADAAVTTVRAVRDDAPKPRDRLEAVRLAAQLTGALPAPGGSRTQVTVANQVNGSGPVDFGTALRQLAERGEQGDADAAIEGRLLLESPQAVAALEVLEQSMPHLGPTERGAVIARALAMRASGPEIAADVVEGIEVHP